MTHLGSEFFSVKLIWKKIRGLKIYSEKKWALKILGFSEENNPGRYSPLKMTTPLHTVHKCFFSSVDDFLFAAGSLLKATRFFDMAAIYAFFHVVSRYVLEIEQGDEKRKKNFAHFETGFWACFKKGTSINMEALERLVG